jgi:hypothetical protein
MVELAAADRRHVGVEAGQPANGLLTRKRRIAHLAVLLCPLTGGKYATGH